LKDQINKRFNEIDIAREKQNKNDRIESAKNDLKKDSGHKLESIIETEGEKGSVL
jgi:hypothetical protein